MADVLGVTKLDALQQLLRVVLHMNAGKLESSKIRKKFAFAAILLGTRN